MFCESAYPPAVCNRTKHEVFRSIFSVKNQPGDVTEPLLITRKTRAFRGAGFTPHFRVIVTAVSKRFNGIRRNFKAIIHPPAANIRFYHLVGRHATRGSVDYVLIAEKVCVLRQIFQAHVRFLLRSELYGGFQNFPHVVDIFVQR